jgi:hypothetical protein
MENLNNEKKLQHQVVQSCFIPESVLQGDEFPIHLIWDKERFININLNIPLNFCRLKEVYNVEEKALKIGKDVVYLNSFERNGYVGFVFSSYIHKEALVEIPVKIEVKDVSGEVEIIENKIIFFRPHVVLYEVPNSLELIRTDNKISIERRIRLKNEGKGTALVHFEISKESDVIVKKPEDIEEFIERFCSKFSDKLEEVKRTYPQYLEITNKFELFFVDLVKGAFKISEQYIKEMKNTFDELIKAFENNENFAIDVLDSILSAYLSAVNIITEVRSFLEYLKSLAENKVILLNAMSMIEFKPGFNFLKGHVFVQDLARNIYEPLEVETIIRVKSGDSITVPLYEIFKWEG